MERVDIQNCERIEISAEHGARSQHGFVIVGDNIDKNVRPSLQREGKKTLSLHYFHSYAMKDRFNIASLSDDPPTAKVTPESILPSEESFQSLLSDFEVLISR